MDAQALLLALQAAGLPVTGICVIDPADVATWRFDGKLTDAERAQAIGIVQGLILAAANPVLVAVPIATLDQVIAWQAGKLGISVDQAVREISVQPAAYAKWTAG